MNTGTLLAGLACFVLCDAAGAQPVLRVRAGAAPGGDGQSWATAHNTLEVALAAAQPHSEIWVAAGTYTRGSGPYCFAMKSNVSVFGGFDGTESQLSERDPVANTATLTGQDARTVVLFRNVVNARLDGFTIRAGLGHGDLDTEFSDSSSSPILCPGGGTLVEASTATIAQCIFVNNRGGQTFWTVPGSRGDGGAIAARTSTLTISDTSFIGNRVGMDYPAGCSGGHPTTYGGAGSGAGVAATNTILSLVRCTFEDNVASTGSSGGTCPTGGASGGRPGGSGGAISVTGGGSLTVDSCRFLRNSAGGGGAGATFMGSECRSQGGVPGNGGAINCLAPLTVSNSIFVANRTQTNTTFCASNTGGRGSAIHCSQTLALRNCLFVGNAAPGTGSGLGSVHTIQQSPTVSNCVFWNNTGDAGDLIRYEIGNLPIGSIARSIIEHLDNPVNGNSASDPLFLNAIGLDNVLGTSDDRFELSWGSPAIDAGSNPFGPATSFDVAGRPRFFDALHVADTGVGPAPIIDIGPHEFSRCPADLSGEATGSSPDGAVTVSDLLGFLNAFERGAPLADLDNGTSAGVLDNAVTIDDLLFFLAHFEGGC